MISLYGCFKILPSLMFVHIYTTLPIKILVSHVEFYLYFIKIKFKKSSVPRTQYTTLILTEVLAEHFENSSNRQSTMKKSARINAS